MKITVKAPAKINLTLDVLGKRPDGYHELATVMQSIDLYDTVTLTDNDSQSVTVSCGYEGVPCDDSNICVKAAHRFFDYCKTDVKGVHIEIDKKIPTQAGLAGGSSDGAAVILGLNAMFNTMLKPAEMLAIGERVRTFRFALRAAQSFAPGSAPKSRSFLPLTAKLLLFASPILSAFPQPRRTKGSTRSRRTRPIPTRW